MGDASHADTGRTSSLPSGRFVAPLEAFGAEDLARAGGKAANLGELIGAGFRVPAGFVVTTDAYESVVERGGLGARIEAELRRAAPEGAAASAAIRAAVAEAEVPEDVRAEIVEAHAAVGGPVAVRSSATAEDLPGAAFAGQQDTYLNVVGTDAVVDAVRWCWASLWTDRAISYRRRRGIDSGDLRIAVVVQAMIDAEAAGVMLTANPVSGARDELVIDASSGLGEAVVSGMVTPDHYVLDRQGQVRERSSGKQEVVVRAAAGGGVTHDTAATAASPGLPGPVLAELARLGVSVAERFGTPQDIEWAHDGEHVWLLQARPLTALPPPPLRLSRIQRVTGPQVIEMLPMRPYPLDMSAWLLPGPARMVGRMLWEIAGVRVRLADSLPESDGVVDRFVPPAPRPTRRTPVALLGDIRRIRRFRPADWTGDPRFAEFERRVRQLSERDPATLPWEELRRVPRVALEALDLITDLRVDHLPGAGVSLVRLRLVLALLRRSGLWAPLVLGAPTRTQDANRALAALASRVRADEGLRERFAALSADELAEEASGGHDLAGLRAALSAFLDEYGHRETASVLLVSQPTWGDAPAVVLGAIKALVEEDERHGESEDRHDAALARLLDHPVLRWTRSRRPMRRAVEAARAGVAFREDSHFHATRVMPATRRALLEMGRRLTEVGVLAEAEDVFHLRLEELESSPAPSAGPSADAERIRGAAQRRAAKREELAGVPLISPAVLFPPSDDDEALVTGTPAGGGRATGPARIIGDAAEFGRLRGGDVLVCPYTNPAWTPLFQRAAAVVVDTGGPSSHAAIVAREYGIPAIMGTGSGTTALVDGQVVTVDGDRGRIIAADDPGLGGQPAGDAAG